MTAAQSGEETATLKKSQLCLFARCVCIGGGVLKMVRVVRLCVVHCRLLARSEQNTVTEVLGPRDILVRVERYHRALDLVHGGSKPSASSRRGPSHVGQGLRRHSSSAGPMLMRHRELNATRSRGQELGEILRILTYLFTYHCCCHTFFPGPLGSCSSARLLLVCSSSAPRLLVYSSTRLRCLRCRRHRRYLIIEILFSIANLKSC